MQYCNNEYLRIPKEVGLGVSLICKIHTQLKVYVCAVKHKRTPEATV
jgi:hypothetical protein